MIILIAFGVIVALVIIVFFLLLKKRKINENFKKDNDNKIINEIQTEKN